VRGLVRHTLDEKARAVLVVALTFKLGLHMASSLLKPMARDFGWSKQRIGWAVMTVGAASALMGAALGDPAFEVGSRSKRQRRRRLAVDVIAPHALPLGVLWN